MGKKIWSMAVGLAMVAAGTASAVAAEKAAPGTEPGAVESGAMSESCRQMLERRAAMEKEMAGMDARLQELTERMNAARGEEKIEAMAAVINQMVAQHQAMRERMQTIGPMMREHMAERMRQGTMACPMMEELPGEPSQPPAGAEKETGHEEHHPK